MKTLLESLREIVGQPDFFIEESSSWDYGVITEYLCCVIIICIVIASIFRFLGKLVDR